MNDNLRYGMVYRFDNQFTHEPRKFGFVRLFQAGELQCSPESEIPEHIQVCHEINCILSGTGTFWCGGTARKIREGDLCLIRRKDLHTIRSDPGENLRILFLGFLFDSDRPEEADRLTGFFDRTGDHCLTRDRCGCSPQMMLLVNEFYSEAAFSDFVVQGLLQQILALTYRNFHQEQPRPFLPPKNAEVSGNVVYSVIRYVESHAAELTEVKELAAALGYSSSYLSHLFRERTGETLQNYLAKKKIARGIDMIKAGRHSMTEISALLGYDSLQSFSKAFRRIAGCSPTEYTRQLREKNPADEKARLSF